MKRSRRKKPLVRLELPEPPPRNIPVFQPGAWPLSPGAWPPQWGPPIHPSGVPYPVNGNGDLTVKDLLTELKRQQNFIGDMIDMIQACVSQHAEKKGKSL